MGDATCSIACVAVYARVLRKNGKYSLILSLVEPKFFRMVPHNPVLSSSLLGSMPNLVTLFDGPLGIDSQAVPRCLTVRLLCVEWTITNVHGVCSQVTKICGLSNLADSVYLSSKDKVADIKTRCDVFIHDVAPGSLWAEGHIWMKEPDALNEQSKLLWVPVFNTI